MLRLVVLSTIVVLATPAPASINERIIGGSPISIGEIPYQVALQKYDAPLCGATIIGKSHILTAAHCTHGSKPDHYTVRYGTSERGRGGDVIQVKEIFEHSHYNSQTSNNDIAVIKLERNFVFSEFSKPATLTFVEPQEGEECLVSGWGRVSQDGQYSEQLLATKVTTVSIKACKEAYWDEAITENMICAGNLEGGKDSCKGDSGGPLVIYGTDEVVGVISWGYRCGEPEIPGVYTNIHKYKSFITSHLY